MKIIKNISLMVICVLALSGCAQKEFIALPENLKDKIDSTDVYVKEDDKKITVQYEKSTMQPSTAGLGLCGAILAGGLTGLANGFMEDNRIEKAVEAETKINKELETFDLQKELEAKVSIHLSQAKWMNVKNIKYSESLNNELIFQDTTSDAVLTCSFMYSLNPKANHLIGTLYFKLYPKSKKLIGLAKSDKPVETPIWQYQASATESIPSHQAGDLKDNVEVWTQNNASYLKSSLISLLDRVFNQASIGLNNPTNAGQ